MEPGKNNQAFQQWIILMMRVYHLLLVKANMIDRIELDKTCFRQNHVSVSKLESGDYYHSRRVLGNCFKWDPPN